MELLQFHPPPSESSIHGVHEGPKNLRFAAIFSERWESPFPPGPALDWRLMLGGIATASIEHVGKGAFRRHVTIPPTAN